VDGGVSIIIRHGPERKFRGGAYDSGCEYLHYNRIKKIESLG